MGKIEAIHVTPASDVIERRPAVFRYLHVGENYASKYFNFVRLITRLRLFSGLRGARHFLASTQTNRDYCCCRNVHVKTWS